MATPNNIQALLAAKDKGNKQETKEEANWKPQEKPERPAPRRIYNFVEDVTATAVQPEKDLNPNEPSCTSLNLDEPQCTPLDPVEPSQTPMNPNEPECTPIKEPETPLGFNRVQQGSDNRVQQGAKKGFNRVQQGAMNPNEPQYTPFQQGSKGFNRVQKNPSVSEAKVLQFLHELNGHETRKSHIATTTGLTFDGVKTAIKRLKTKGFINLVSYSSGAKTGYVKYELTGLAIEYLAQEGTANLNQKSQSQWGSMGCYSSSSNINTTTTGESEPLLIPPILLEAGATQKTFTKYTNKLSVEEIQRSLDAFAHDLEAGTLKSKSPLNVLFGVLRKGNSYLSTDYAQSTAKEINEVLERNRQLEEKQRELAEANFKARYLEWKLKSAELIEKLLEGESAIKRSEKLKEAFLMAKFRDIDPV